MGGGTEEEEDWAAGLPPSLAGVKLVDAPVLFLVVSHKAFRSELGLVRALAAEAAESGVYSCELVVDLGRRLDFLKVAYNYHTAAEDEVIFLALDAHVKNVVATYSLEHNSIDEKFSSIFLHLDLLMNSDEESPQTFQDLLFSIGTVEAMICQHMQKEEQQVFPLLTKKFTSEEQSQLVWQYFCSVPIILLEDFLPWLSFYLSPDEKREVLHCIRLIIPKETLLLEVVVSLLEHREESSSEAYVTYGKGYQILNGLSGSKNINKLYPPQIHCERDRELKEDGSVQTNRVEGPIKGVYHWHTALRRDLTKIVEELYEIRSSNSVASLSSVIVHLKFIADVLIYYSNSLDNLFYPLLSQLATNGLSPWRQLIDESQINCLQRFLFYNFRGSVQLRSFMEMLYKELETLVRGFSMNLTFLETEVFPFISNNCTQEMQLWLLYTSLHVMPLGLLRCTITWFSAQLSENESCSILDIVKVGCPAVSKSFTSLLYEWIRIGSSGKASTAKFRQNLEEMFNGRSFYLVEQMRPKALFLDELEPMSAMGTLKSFAISSSSVLQTTEELMSYPNGMSLQVFFSQMFKRISRLENSQAEPSFSAVESRPMDHILYIHRALGKDLKYLVSLSAMVSENLGLLAEFKKRFDLFRIVYQFHSISEDEIAFPALESKIALQNVSHSYSIEHILEMKQIEKASEALNEICALHDDGSKETRLKHHQLCLKLHDTCLAMHNVLSDHIFREEVEIFSLFREHFSVEEEEKIVGNMLGIIRAEILQQMIPWLMAYLTSDEQQAITSLWLKVARYTKFGDWLREWWEDVTRYNLSKVEDGSKPSPLLVADPLEVVSLYLLKDGIQTQKDEHNRGEQTEPGFDSFKHSGSCNADREALTHGGRCGCQSQEVSLYPSEVDKKRSNETKGPHDDEKVWPEKECQKLNHQEHPLCMNQEELEATIRRVSRDSTLDSQKKSIIIQSLLTSQWIITQKMSLEADVANDGEIPGQSPSYRDSLKQTFGCEHYKRNSKLLAPCCNKLYTCIRCHDDVADHVLDRKSVTKMMCMKCLVIQPIGPKCINSACRDFSMGKYYCRICKLFDDERKIYHCPYCNLCRVGKGLGIDYFHCMKCNACMSRSLFVHVCREKCLEDNCPICHEYIFTSNSPVKALPCGHLMHSSCFQDYTCSHYICPVCSKSLGDMQVYFGMLDALLAEEKIPEEYSDQIQAILCNDCERRGTASFHWLYHKCPHCGSYNTRLL